MNAISKLYYSIHNAIFLPLRHLDGLAPLALRLYLAPVFWMAGKEKLSHMDGIIAWFGEGGLGLPFPTLMAYLAAYTEAIGALALLLGIATRWVSIPLMVTMLVAIFAVHIDNGWAVIADSGSQEVAVRLGAAKELLKEHGNYGWLTEKGNFVVLNNGIEFAVTYLIMLFSLLFTGGGRYVSVDYYLSKLFPNRA